MTFPLFQRLSVEASNDQSGIFSTAREQKFDLSAVTRPMQQFIALTTPHKMKVYSKFGDLCEMIRPHIKPWFHVKIKLF